MTVANLIKSRISQKTYTDQAIKRSLIEELLEVSVFTPNHKMREPWRFIVIDGKEKEVLKTRYLEHLSKDHRIDIEKKIRQNIYGSNNYRIFNASISGL
jgi:nitroreductase